MKTNALFRKLIVRPLAAIPLLALALGLAGAMAVSPLAADEDMRIKSAEVRVEPEYDEPRVLVVNQGTFVGDSFPKEVSFYLPKGVEVTEVCGLKKPQDEHLCQLYETRLEGDATVLTYKLPVPDYYFEYYYNPIQGTGDRAIDFSYRPSYPTDNLQVHVQQPLRSTGFAISPSSSQVTSDGQGFKFYQYNFSDLSPQKPVDLKITYQKSDDRPSVAKQKTGNTSTGGTEDRTGLIALGIGGAGALGFFAYLAVRRRPEAVQVVSRRGNIQPAAAGRRSGAGPARGKGRGADPAFCSKCGVPLQGDENFCSGCGQRVRRQG
ncbi:MAG: zinc ribbon domain-containing protein [Dehalococcoidia bacterium]|nr:zinc ribbon domain-containing protein [Dehalococcoidia bacterium]